MRKIVLLLSFLLVAATSASAGMPDAIDHPCRDCDLHRPVSGGMMGMGMDRMGEMMGVCLRHAKEIGLTPDQIAKITPIHREMQKMQIRYRADLQIAEMDLKDILSARDFDLEKANDAVKRIGEIRTTHQLDMLKSMKQARAILTDAQFAKMKELVPQMMKNMMPGKGMMHHHGPRR